jgi:hypothetical protein
MTSTALPHKILDSVSLASSFSSESYEMRYLYSAGIIISCTGVTHNTGSFIIEASNDKIKWVDMGVSPTMKLADTSKDFLCSIDKIPFDQIRITFTPGGATPNGTASATIVGKAEA